MKKYLSLVVLMMIMVFVSSCKNNDDISSEIQTTSFEYTSNEAEISEVKEVEVSEVLVNSGEYECETTDVIVNLDTLVISNSNNYITLKNDNVFEITSGGTYVFSGTLEDGQIIINALSGEKVYIVLNGVSIKSKKNAPLLSLLQSKTYITLATNSVNYLEDALSYTYENSNEEPNACLYSKKDLTIDGDGELYVVGNFNNGIGCKADLKIKNGNINVIALNNAIKGNNSIEIKKGIFTIKSDSDALKSDDTKDSENGYIEVTDGTFNITAGNDAFDATNTVTIENGVFNIITGGGSSKTITNSDTGSYKAIKGANGVIINGGTFSINSKDDAIHSDNVVTITAGTFVISSGDDGIHADSNLNISGGVIDIIKSYEGLEALEINITSGNIKITASDDGINAAGGADGSSSMFQATSNGLLKISGGFIVVNASGDGLDANGSIEISGGTIIVFGPTSNNDGALDFDNTLKITGGILVALGSSGMAQNISSISTQYGFLVGFNSVTANTILNITDFDGNEILTIISPKAYQSIVVSTPQITNKMTYTLKTGGTYSGGENMSGYLTGGTYSGGSTLTTVTTSGIATSSSISGGAGFGGDPNKPGGGALWHK